MLHTAMAHEANSTLAGQSGGTSPTCWHPFRSLRAGPLLGAGFVFAAVALSGCSSTSGGLSGARLYSAERDKQGQAAKEAWSKVDLKSQIEVPRQNLAKTLAEQIAIEEDIWMKRRGIQAGRMAGSWTVDEFRETAGAELLRVVGGADAHAAEGRAREYKGAANKVETATNQLDGPINKMEASGIAPPPCSVAMDDAKLAEYNKAKLQSVSEARAAIYAGSMKSLVTACETIASNQTAAAKAAGGELGKARRELADEEAALERAKVDADLLLTNLKTAQAEYEAAEKELKGNPGQTKDKVNSALDKLRALVEELPGSVNPDAKAGDDKLLKESAIATKLFSQERLDAINKFLENYDSVLKGDGTAAGSNRLAVALALFPDLQQKSQEALANADQPNLTPLILRKKIEQTKLDTANRDLERMHTVIGLRRQIVTGLEAQLYAYQNAYEGSKQVNKTIAKWSDALQPIEEKPGEPVPISVKNEKVAAWKASSQFLEAEGRMRADVGQNYYRVYALQSEGALLYAESSIQQWKGLIDPSVDLLAQWGASGVTSNDVIQLFNSLMLLGIAIGVN